MVGWSRRARESSERARRYRQWFNSLPKEEQDRITEAERVRWERDKWKVYTCMALGFVLMFVVWPLMCYYFSTHGGIYAH